MYMLLLRHPAYVHSGRRSFLGRVTYKQLCEVRKVCKWYVHVCMYIRNIYNMFIIMFRTCDHIIIIIVNIECMYIA